MKKKFLLLAYILTFSMVTIFTALITKDKNAQAASNIYLSSKSFALEIDHYKTLKVKGTTRYIRWRSSNPRVATVSSGGRVFAMGSGTTTISAEVAGKRLTCKVSVYQISKENLTLAPQQSKTLVVWGPVKKLTWTTSNPEIATVTNNGTITGHAKGTAIITANADGKELTCKVKVGKLDHDSVVLELGGKYGYAKTIKLYSYSGTIKWSSSHNGIATVSKSGFITAKGPGTATITATVGDAKFTCKVTVIKMTTKEFTLNIGETKQLGIYGTTNEVTWYSNQKSVATVSADGTVTAQGKGDAYIMANVDGKRVMSRVIVK